MTGKDGNFNIKITNPQYIAPQTVNQLLLASSDPANPSKTRIQHRLQKSPELSFNTQSLLTELPLTYDTDLVDKDPNQTKYWRLQSRFDGGPYNQWQYWVDPAFCGPVAVWSGLLTTADSDLLMSPATTTDGSVALSQDGVTTNILVAAKTWNVGTQQISYGSGAVDPGAFGSYQIYAIDLKKQGGSVTYIATLNLGDLTKQDGITYFGNIKTTNAGGGVARGGGQGGGGCVVRHTLIVMADGSQKEVELLRKGERVMGIDGKPETLQADPHPRFAPVFTIWAEDKILRGCSNMHLLLRENGMPVHTSDIHAPFTVMHWDGLVQITRKQLMGVELVFELKLDGTKTYCADGFWSHNKIFVPL